MMECIGDAKIKHRFVKSASIVIYNVASLKNDDWKGKELNDEEEGLQKYMPRENWHVLFCG